MEDTKKALNNHPRSKWVRGDDSAEVYSNQFYLDWSMTDVRIRFGQMIPTDRPEDGKVGFVIEEQAAVTMAWPQLKAFRDAVNNAVERYEKTNGEINLNKLKLPQ
jgi:hypothetical protein